MKSLSRTTAVACVIALSACTPQKKPVSERNVPAEDAIVVDAKDAAAVDTAPIVKSSEADTELRRINRRDMSDSMAAPVLRERTSTAFMPTPPPHYRQERENYAKIEANGIFLASEVPVSTLSIDVDTGSYSNVRSLLNRGQLPPADAVRVEEMINYFDFDYGGPDDVNTPFSVSREIAKSPWNSANHLLKIGIKGFVPENVDQMAANLVFLIDVSGSMASPDKLGLLKTSLKQLTAQLDRNDSVAIVVYAGASGVVLPPTTGDQRANINAALSRLQAGGATNGAAGIELAYALARQSFKPGGVNRVLLATDGDFNVGTTDIESLKTLIERQRESGIALTTLGFGRGNYNDALMEQLADIGNGNHAYIDTPHEARKVLVDELAATMMTIAKDVKIQIEFNPAVVAEYRLIGYENRLLNREDFNNDNVDAGEIGAGHTVTALYELTLVGDRAGMIDPLRYSEPVLASAKRSELAFLKLRYKKPSSERSELLSWPIASDAIHTPFERASTDMQFAVSVAAFGQLLRGGSYIGSFDYDDIHELARRSRGDDPFGRRAEFASLVRLAGSLAPVPDNMVGQRSAD